MTSFWYLSCKLFSPSVSLYFSFFQIPADFSCFLISPLFHFAFVSSMFISSFYVLNDFPHALFLISFNPSFFLYEDFAQMALWSLSTGILLRTVISWKVVLLNELDWRMSKMSQIYLHLFNNQFLYSPVELTWNSLYSVFHIRHF